MEASVATSSSKGGHQSSAPRHAPLRPERDTCGLAGTGAGPVWITTGFPAAGWFVLDLPRCGLTVVGHAGAAVGPGTRVTGANAVRHRLLQAVSVRSARRRDRLPAAGDSCVLYSASGGRQRSNIIRLGAFTRQRYGRRAMMIRISGSGNRPITVEDRVEAAGAESIAAPECEAASLRADAGALRQRTAKSGPRDGG